MIVGGSPWSVALARALKGIGLPVIIVDPNYMHLRAAREAEIETYFGDLLSEDAEHRLDLVRYEQVIAATDNDAYNTLVTTDLGPEFGREKVFQLKRSKDSSARHALPATLGGRPIGPNETYLEANARIRDGWEFRATKLSKEFTLSQWREKNPKAFIVADFGPDGSLRFLGPEAEPRDQNDVQILVLAPKREERKEA
jgi:hypothetical protein